MSDPLDLNAATPEELILRLREQGVGAIDTIRLVRERFGLSLREAKERWVQMEGWASLAEVQASLVPALGAALGESGGGR